MIDLHGRSRPDFPDVNPGCCIGSAEYGPPGCTCWKRVHDQEQVAVGGRTDGLPAPRPKMCEDCAFRPNSPERQGVEGYENNDGGEGLAELVEKGEPFYCHQGMRKIVKWRHPVGAEIDGHPANFDPPIVVGPMEQFVPMKADGTPADICAGWWARYAQGLKTGTEP